MHSNASTAIVTVVGSLTSCASMAMPAGRHRCTISPAASATGLQSCGTCRAQPSCATSPQTSHVFTVYTAEVLSVSNTGVSRAIKLGAAACNPDTAANPDMRRSTAW